VHCIIYSIPDGGISQNGILSSSSCLHSDFLGPVLGRGRMSSGKEGCLSSFEVDVDGPGE
jgi:hypothetical protein